MDALCIEDLPEALFAEAVILVEGTTEQAILEGCAERDGAPLAVDGIGETDIAGILAAHRRDNRRLPRFVGSPEEDWPSTGAHTSYAVFNDDLETDLNQSWPGWRETRHQLIKIG